MFFALLINKFIGLIRSTDMFFQTPSRTPFSNISSPMGEYDIWKLLSRKIEPDDQGIRITAIYFHRIHFMKRQCFIVHFIW